MCGPPSLAVIPDLSNTAPAPLYLGALAGFLCGSIPFAYLLGRARGIDLRRIGSGNVGATNLARGGGLPLGIAGFLLDALKGAAPAVGVGLAGGDEGAQALAGGSAVLGHCFSPFLRFRGGKGVATMAGALAVLSPWILLVLAAAWAASMAALRNVGISSSITALGALGLGVGLLVVRSDAPSSALALLLIALSLLVIARHRSNLRRYFARSAEAGR